jgi:hypothetical protein
LRDKIFRAIDVARCAVSIVGASRAANFLYRARYTHRALMRSMMLRVQIASHRANPHKFEVFCAPRLRCSVGATL